MNSVHQHYSSHLSKFYTWSLGNAASNAETLLKEFQPELPKNGIIVDLGTGGGFHAELLSKDYEVIAIDACQELLDEAKRRSTNSKIQWIQDDILHFQKFVPNGRPASFLCLGDTLTHLGSMDEVETLLSRISDNLKKNSGMVALSFRDYSRELNGTDRFISVRSDERRIHTCFLEYAGPKLIVTDLLHELIEGKWQMTVGSYSKTRVDPLRVSQLLNDAGIQVVRRQIAGGMIFITGTVSA